MSIAEKLTTVAENQQKVYDVGKKTGIDKTCPAINEHGAIVACKPIEDYPLTVTTVAEATEITRLGKNLFDFTQTPTQVTYPTSSGTPATRYGFAITLPGGTYTLHAEEIAPSNAQYYLYGVVAKADGTLQGSCNLRVGEANYTCTVTVEDGGTIYIYDGTTGSQSAAKALFSKFNVQIELGDYKSAFEPFQAPEIFAPGGTISAKPGVNTFYADVGDVTVTGRQSEYDKFWDAFQINGTKTNYQAAFSRSGWTDTSYNPKYHIVTGTGSTSAQEMFYNNAITDTKVDITIGATGSSHVFAYCVKLVTIRKLTVTEKTKFANWFESCNALQNITFGEDAVIANSISFAWSSNLTNASVQSVIDHLKDLTGATTQTFTLHATVGEALTEEQKAAISAKNWTLVY